MSETKVEILQEVSITEKAAKRLLQIKTKDEGDYLRASVKGGGCSGLNYNLEWDKTVGEFDKIFETNGIKLIVDLKSLLYLKGMEVDFSTDMLSGGFQFNNPNANRTCGCGTSFSV